MLKIDLPELKYFDVFEKDGTLFEVETDKISYEFSAQPTYPKGRWVKSFSCYRLPVGTYCNENDKQCLVNTDGETYPVGLDEVKENELTRSGVSRIEKLKTMK